MKWFPLAAAFLIVMLLLVAGCSDQQGEEGDNGLPPSDHAPRFVAGDIVSKIGVQEEPLWLILGYDNTTDTYTRAFIYKKIDGTWGYRKDSRSDSYPRADMEKLYPVKVAHVKVSLVPITSQNTLAVETTAPSTAGPAPEISGITPNSGPSGVYNSIDITGKNFVSGLSVTLAGASSPTIQAVNVGNTNTKITAVFDLLNATPGLRDLIVTNPDGQSAVLTNGFTINNPAPAIGNINPVIGTAGATLTITISGANFKTPAQVYFVKNGSEIDGGNVQVKSTTLLTAVLVIPPDVEAGTWGVIVRNVADNQNSTTLRKFTIQNKT